MRGLDSGRKLYGSISPRYLEQKQIKDLLNLDDNILADRDKIRYVENKIKDAAIGNSAGGLNAAKREGKLDKRQRTMQLMNLRRSL